MNKKKLIETVRSLRARLQLTISEYDDTELREATAIRIEYTEKIGQYECRQYELYLQFEELKRKIEMVQARINRGEEIDINAINNEVAGILEAYYEKLNGMRHSVAEMEGYQAGALVSGSDRAEIKHIYRKLMKVLHPDVADPEYGFDPDLWKKAQDAYKRNDLDTLQMIYDIVSETKDVSLEYRDESELMEMVERMELAIKRYRMLIGEIRRKFPFTEIEHLQNDAWVRARQAEIKNSIEEYQKTIMLMAATLNALVCRKG